MCDMHDSVCKCILAECYIETNVIHVVFSSHLFPAQTFSAVIFPQKGFFPRRPNSLLSVLFSFSRAEKTEVLSEDLLQVLISLHQIRVST